MKLADITIIDSGQVELIRCKKPSKVTLSFLSSLINNPDFVRELSVIADEYGVAKAHPIEEYKTLCNDPDGFYDFMKGSLDGIMARFNLPGHYRYSMFLLVVFRAFIDIPEDERSDIVYLEHPGEIARFTEGLEDNLEQISAIALGSQCTKRELIDWINENWDEIEPKMKEVLPVRPKKGKVYKNVSLAQEAYEMRKDGNTYNEISDILTDKYPDNPNVSDIAWLKNLVIRHIQKSKQFARQFPRLAD